MKKITRREFLRLLLQSAGASAVVPLLQACGIRPAEEPGTPTNTPFGPSIPEVSGVKAIAGASAQTGTPSPSETPAPTDIPPTATAEPAYLAVARGGDDPEELVRRAVGAIGGIGRFVPQGANVIIKPNICTANRAYTFAATTNPWVVGALVKMCREAGAGRVAVYDYPFDGTSYNAYQTSGIAEQVQAAGGEMEVVSAEKFTAVQPQGTVSFLQAKVYRDILKADVVIDVPIAKHHGLTGLTLAMKNLMGVVQNRPAIHANVHRQLAELSAFIRPALTVIDAVRILLAGGPLGGSLGDVRKMDTVIASADIVAADAYAATRLFGWSSPDKLGYVRIGAEIGLGRSDLENLAIEEITVGD
ncbi:MAG: DUF362 domain-containing protein [Anaerolineales bacterium]